MKILVTGGAGYIGSHTCIELMHSGHEVVVVDNFDNSSPVALDRVATITGVKPTYYEVDICDKAALSHVFQVEKPDAVIHFAALKAVGESVSQSLRYYQNNIGGTLVLLDVMQDHQVKNIIFSSSATVYGDPHTVPILETFPLSTTNPYGATKLMTEQILQDLHTSDPSWNVVLLRYFNPIGAHESGLIGEDPKGIPNNLIPYVSKVAVGQLAHVNVFGDDYDTVDGTGVRDYIHVVDLAKGHVAALKDLVEAQGVTIYNLGTGMGYSVLQIIEAMSEASGVTIDYVVGARRPGDIATCYADATKAFERLGWKAMYDLKRMCEDTWRWQSQNPNGFETTEI